MTEEQSKPWPVPEGWVLVPRDLVREQWAASGDAQMKLRADGNHNHDATTGAVWSALCAAAPIPPGSEGRAPDPSSTTVEEIAREVVLQEMLSFTTLANGRRIARVDMDELPCRLALVLTHPKQPETDK